MVRKLAAEGIGTFWLVFMGCGSALFAADHISFHGIALAFGLTVLTMAAAVGPISGGHFNPAVTLGLVVAGRHRARELGPYVLAQLLGAFTAAGLLAFIVHDQGRPLGQFAANGYGTEAMGATNHVSAAGAFLIEAVTTFIFMTVILGCTTKGSSVPGLPPIAIGLCLALIHLVTIPLTNTSVNPARSTPMAIYAGGIYVQQLWLFWAAPLVGGAAAGALAKWLYQPREVWDA